MSPSDVHDERKPRLFTVDDVCKILRIGRTAVYELIRSGRLATVKIGARRLFIESEVEAFIATLTDEGSL